MYAQAYSTGNGLEGFSHASEASSRHAHQPFPELSTSSAAAAAFSVPNLPPIRTGFGSPIKGAAYKEVSAKGMAHSASFSDWVPPQKATAKPPVAKPPAGRPRASQPAAAKPASSARRGAAMLGCMLLALVLLFAVIRAGGNGSQQQRADIQHAKLQFTAQASQFGREQPDAAAPAGERGSERRLHSARGHGGSKAGGRSHGRHMLRGTLWLRLTRVRAKDLHTLAYVWVLTAWMCLHLRSRYRHYDWCTLCYRAAEGRTKLGNSAAHASS